MVPYYPVTIDDNIPLVDAWQFTMTVDLPWACLLIADIESWLWNGTQTKIQITKMKPRVDSRKYQKHTMSCLIVCCDVYVITYLRFMCQELLFLGDFPLANWFIHLTHKSFSSITFLCSINDGFSSLYRGKEIRLWSLWKRWSNWWWVCPVDL